MIGQPLSAEGIMQAEVEAPVRRRFSNMFPFRVGKPGATADRSIR